MVTEIKIKLTQALAGADITLKSLDGDIILKVPEGTNNGDILRVRGKGVPSEHGPRGDLLVHIHVDMSKKLSKAAREAVERLKQEGV